MPFFKNGKSTIHYYEYGEGTEILFAFHGFGMRGTQFDILKPALTERYKIYSFDLFFHGETELEDISLKAVRKGLSAKEFSQWILDFMDTIHARDKKISLISYSMGALLAWSIIEAIPQQIEATFFIAPDGIAPNRLLQICAKNPVINRLIYQLVYSPKTVNFLLKQLHRFHYIDDPLYRILSQEFGTTETRLTCYQAITYTSRFIFHPNRLAALLNKHDIVSYLYFGKHDKLFPARIGIEFSKKLTHTHLHVFDEGHELVNEHLNEVLGNQIMVYDKRQA